MTQQYIVGEFSSLLAGLQPAPGELLADAVGSLRHEVEFGALPMLPRLAQDALSLADMICQAALDQRDAEGFCHYLGNAIALRDFTLSAGLLPDQ
jgi:hypothetical protein